MLKQIVSELIGKRHTNRNLTSSDGNTLPALKNTGVKEGYDERENKLASRPVSIVLPVVNKVSSFKPSFCIIPLRISDK